MPVSNVVPKYCVFLPVSNVILTYLVFLAIYGIPFKLHTVIEHSGKVCHKQILDLQLRGQHVQLFVQIAREISLLLPILRRNFEWQLFPLRTLLECKANLAFSN